ncbi:GtrA family protein [Paraburkholderia sp. Ac-20347]|uniref:GtrA family protein n=1 Tax=Paraburkholderia sp. Ac-20347 TaxID=2703892 RepID=UPI001980F541|nr:GtrA family protein [Paraburkholderia sp. Ac-20347]MBN3808175.1 GtrA family protein [Paraburkholderia sp. Ac-20347]
MYAQFFRFAIAGTIGFLVDAGVLYLALKCGTGPYVGRVISFLCAAFVTWQINRRTTFRGSKQHAWMTEWLRYLAAMSLGGICNYGAYAVALKTLPPGAFAPLLAVAAGSIVGMFVNFAFAKWWVFARTM